MASVTQGGSKEMLMVGKLPVIGWVIQEAIQAGADSVVVVSSQGKHDLNEWLQSQSQVRIVMQERQLGLGHAIACALDAEESAPEDALVLLGDTIYAGVPLIPNTESAAAILVEEVTAEAVGRYGIVELEGDRATRLVEKPKPGETSSRWAVAGRYWMSGASRLLLREWTAKMVTDRFEGEIGISEFLNSLMQSFPVQAVKLAPELARFDCGSMKGYELACKELAR